MSSDRPKDITAPSYRLFDEELDERKLGEASTLTAESAHDVESRDEFARGVVDAIRQICAVLIGRGIVDAGDLQTPMKRLSDFWRQRGLAERAEPADILFEAFGGMEKAKREFKANMFLTAPGTQ